LAGSGFEYVSELGRGGMGVVIEVRDKQRGDVCALKIIRSGLPGAERLLDRLRLEGETLSKGNTPHFVGYRGGGVLPDGSRYYAMDKLEGRTVRDRLEEGPLSLRDTLSAGIQLL